LMQSAAVGQGATPVSAGRGLVPMSPTMVDTPVFVMPEPARTLNPTAVPRSIVVAAWAGAALPTVRARPPARAASRRCGGILTQAAFLARQ